MKNKKDVVVVFIFMALIILFPGIVKTVYFDEIAKDRNITINQAKQLYNIDYNGWISANTRNIFYGEHVMKIMNMNIIFIILGYQIDIKILLLIMILEK